MPSSRQLFVFLGFFSQYGTNGDDSCADWDGETSEDNSDGDCSGDEVKQTRLKSVLACLGRHDV